MKLSSDDESVVDMRAQRDDVEAALRKLQAVLKEVAAILGKAKVFFGTPQEFWRLEDILQPYIEDEKPHVMN